MATGLDKFKKKWGASIERTKKEGRKAAEGHLLKAMADKKEATMSTEEKAMQYFKENNITVPEDEQYTIMTMSFYNKMEQDMRENITAELTTLNTEKDEEEMTAEQIKAIVTEVMAAMNENRNNELALQIKLQEAQNDALRMQLELAELAMERHLSGMDNNAPVNAAKAQVEEQFVEKPKRGRRKGSVNKKKNKVEEVVTTVNPALEDIRASVAKINAVNEEVHKAIEEYQVNSLIPTQYIRESGRINWKAIQNDDKFLTIVASIVGDAVERGIDVTNANVFRKSSNIAGAAYQRFMDENKGIRGAWKAFLMELGVQVG